MLNSSIVQLTLHLHLRVGLAVAVHIGGVADVLARVLAPHAGQRQHAVGHCVLPRKRRPQLGPRDLGRGVT